MKLIANMLRRVNGLSRQSHQHCMIRTFITDHNSGDASNEKNTNSFESADDFERRIFSGTSGNNSSTDAFSQLFDRIQKPEGNKSSTEAFFQKFDRTQKPEGKYGGDGYKTNYGSTFQFLDGPRDGSFNTLSDGLDGKLKKAATYFAYDAEEIEKDGYKFRPDVTFMPGATYTPRDLDLTKPGLPKTFKRWEFKTTTEEALRKADFRNVRFLQNFITAAGILKKRRMTGISAKAQRKVAREVKTARAFGLMPFTTMGQPQFQFGRTRQDLDDFGPSTRRALYPEPEAEENVDIVDPILVPGS